MEAALYQTHRQAHRQPYWDVLTNNDLSLGQLVELSQQVRQDSALALHQQANLLREITQQIWQRSIFEFDGCG